MLWNFQIFFGIFVDLWNYWGKQRSVPKNRSFLRRPLSLLIARTMVFCGVGPVFSSYFWIYGIVDVYEGQLFQKNHFVSVHFLSNSRTVGFHRLSAASFGFPSTFPLYTDFYAKLNFCVCSPCKPLASQSFDISCFGFVAGLKSQMFLVPLVSL